MIYIKIKNNVLEFCSISLLYEHLLFYANFIANFEQYSNMLTIHLRGS